MLNLKIKNEMLDQKSIARVFMALLKCKMHIEQISSENIASKLFNAKISLYFSGSF